MGAKQKPVEIDNTRACIGSCSCSTDVTWSSPRTLVTSWSFCSVIINLRLFATGSLLLKLIASCLSKSCCVTNCCSQ
ncbi:hypothetical protein HanPI659440_Chr02g0080571 [Helianthus annuus]|nr:hypothetical protein HanPI659440_Chr02g0080571 [Helianthus annuus]